MSTKSVVPKTTLSGSTGVDVVLREHEVIASLPNVVRSIRRFVEAPLLKRLHHAMKSLASGEEMNQIMAAYSGDMHLDALEGETVQHPSTQTALMKQIILYAAEHCSTCVVQWALTTTAAHLAITEQAARVAIRCNHLAILELLYPSMKASISPSQEYSLFNEAMYTARGDDTNILEWMLARRMHEYTVRSMWNAAQHIAGRGDLDLLKWIHANITNQCYWNTLRAAVLNGHRHVMDWIHENGVQSNVREVMRAAMMKRDFDALAWLHEKYPTYDRISIWTFRELVHHGKMELDMIVWLLMHYPEHYSRDGVTMGALCGDLEAAKWFVAHHYPTKNQVKSAMITAAKHGNLAVLQWFSSSLYSHRLPDRALWSAVTHGHLDVVRWITEQQTLSNLLTRERLARMQAMNSRQQGRDLKSANGCRVELTRWLETQQQALDSCSDDVS